jgi:NitT/TauT family transport system permease protein
MTTRARRLWQAGSIAALVVLWELIVRAGGVDPLFVPPPSAVVAALARTGPEAAPLLVATLGRTLVAYALSVALGVSLGLVIGAARHLYEVLNPFLVGLYAVPKILVLPWILLVFGLGPTPAVVYGALHGFFPICLLTIGGVRDVERTPIVVARSMGATPGQIYRKVILPAVVPAVLAGMRLGIVFCLLGVLVAELFGGIEGVGFLLGSLANAFRAADLFAATALVSVVSVAAVLALERLNRHLSRWR